MHCPSSCRRTGRGLQECWGGEFEVSGHSEARETRFWEHRIQSKQFAGIYQSSSEEGRCEEKEGGGRGRDEGGDGIHESKMNIDSTMILSSPFTGIGYL